MWRIIQVVTIGTLCAAVFALLYDNTTPVSISFFGSALTQGTLGGSLLLAFFSGFLVAGLGALLFAIRQSFETRRIAARERRMRRGWEIFSEAQLSELLGDSNTACKAYEELLRTVPEADAAIAPLSTLGALDTLKIPTNGSALIDFIHGRNAEQDGAFGRATEKYTAAYEHAKIPALLRHARDAAIKAELIEKATALHKQLALVTKLTEADIEIESELAARTLPKTPEERAPRLRDLVRQYPSSAVLVTELAEYENASGKSDNAALLLGKIARQHPSPERIAAFETQLMRLPLERALSITEQNAKGDTAQIFIPTKLAILLHHRAVSAANDLWSSIADPSSKPRWRLLGAALAVLTDRKDAAIVSLCTINATQAIRALESGNEQRGKKVIGLAPQFSTP